jgi:hypothetical protein
MISVNEITLKGLHGQEINFYTGEDVKEDIYLAFYPETEHGILPKRLAGEIGPGLGVNLVFGFSASLYSVHGQLQEVYDTFKCTKAPIDDKLLSAGDILLSSNMTPQYQIAIHKLFYTLNKLCYGAVLIKADKIIPRDGGIPPSIRSLFDINYPNQYKEQIIENVFRREESKEVFSVVEDINSIFQSYHMYTLLNMIGKNMPTVCAFGPPGHPDYAFLQHNHSLWQIIKAVDTALKDINLL